MQVGFNFLDGGKVVIKKINLKTEENLKDARKESAALKKLNHPNIVRYLDEHETKSLWGSSVKEFRIVMEYCEGGELRTAIDSKRINGNRRIF